MASVWSKLPMASVWSRRSSRLPKEVPISVVATQEAAIQVVATRSAIEVVAMRHY
jgi:hypothetical protein